MEHEPQESETDLLEIYAEHPSVPGRLDTETYYKSQNLPYPDEKLFADCKTVTHTFDENAEQWFLTRAGRVLNKIIYRDY